MSYTLIETQTYKTGQAWRHDEYRDYGNGSKRRVEIKRDAYEEQSKAAVYSWNIANGWLFVMSLPIQSTPAREVSYVHNAEQVGSRLVDTAEMLFARAAKILR
jgi:hypothetical protein